MTDRVLKKTLIWRDYVLIKIIVNILIALKENNDSMQWINK